MGCQIFKKLRLLQYVSKVSNLNISKNMIQIFLCRCLIFFQPHLLIDRFHFMANVHIWYEVNKKIWQCICFTYMYISIWNWVYRFIIRVSRPCYVVGTIENCFDRVMPLGKIHLKFPFNFFAEVALTDMKFGIQIYLYDI